MRRVTLLIAAVLLMTPVAGAAAADPQRWTPTGTSSLPLDYWQGVTVDPQGNLYFDGVVWGLYRTDPALRETGRRNDAIPASVRMGEGYNHIGDLSWDASEGGRLLLPLECYYPGEPRRQHMPDRLDRRRRPAVPAVALLREARPRRDPEGDVERGVARRRAGLDLQRRRPARLPQRRTSRRRTRRPPAAPIHSVRRLVDAVPPSGITGATFVGGRLFVAGQDRRAVPDLVDRPHTGARVLEAEREIVGESEGLATASVNGGTLQWLIPPFDPPGRPPTYGAGHSTLLSLRPGPPDPPPPAAPAAPASAPSPSPAGPPRVRLLKRSRATVLRRRAAGRARELPGGLHRADHGARPRSHHRARLRPAVRHRPGASHRRRATDAARAPRRAADAADHRARRGRAADTPDHPRRAPLRPGYGTWRSRTRTSSTGGGAAISCQPRETSS